MGVAGWFVGPQVCSYDRVSGALDGWIQEAACSQGSMWSVSVCEKLEHHFLFFIWPEGLSASSHPEVTNCKKGCFTFQNRPGVHLVCRAFAFKPSLIYTSA